VYQYIQNGASGTPIIDSLITEKPDASSLDKKIVEDFTLQKMDSVRDIQSFLATYAGPQSSGNFRTFDAVQSTTAPRLLSASEAASTKAGGGTFMQTNNQVANVDEADVIKTNGDFIYYLNGQNLQIFNNHSEENPTEVLANMEFKTSPYEMYLDGTTLVVLGHAYNSGELDLIRPYSQYTQVDFIDVANPRSPKITNSYTLEGRHVTSRSIDGTMYLVTSAHVYDWAGDPIPYPIILRNSEQIATRSTVYFPGPIEAQYSYTNVVVFDVDSGELEMNEQYLLDATHTVYASEDFLYLTYTKYLNEDEIAFDIMHKEFFSQLPTVEQKQVNEILNAPSYLLNDYEKRNKARQIYEKMLAKQSEVEQKQLRERMEDLLTARFIELEDKLEETIVHKIKLDGAQTEYITSGSVVGSLLNQFSMDEHEGNFRVATTRRDREYISPELESENILTILDEDLQQLGQITDIAKGEQIYSVRFMGDRGYVVTFEQVDPLFIIDLENPQSPRITGELKIPGFSTYLHPLPNNQLLGIGRDTRIDENNRVRTGGMKLSLFDVSDDNNPTEVTNLIIGKEGTYSEALNNHKQVHVYLEKGKVFFPISISDDTPFGDIGRTQAGTASVSFTQDSLTLDGVIVHESSEKYYSDMQDNTYIENELYTISPRLLKVHTIDELGEIHSLVLPKTDRGGDVYPMPILFEEDLTE
jgi:uncharacterized secreted protein with C-terminal beta-propeller domain